ncbi:MAG: tetratricopeptide repeat protein, partial [Elsteraceae bacterium]
MAIKKHPALVVFALLAIWSTASIAQAPLSGEAASAKYDAAFQAMLADPGDLDKTFAYAELAVEIGNFEGAISALERMLLLNPNLPRVRLELGVLYYRIGSFDVAAEYFNAVRGAEDAPAPVRARVDEFLKAIETAKSPHSLTVSLTTGMRYQSNANAASNQPDNIRSPFGVLSLPDNQRARGDFNGFALAAVNYRYDLQNQDADALEVGVTLYGTQQMRVTRLNVGLMEMNVGPRFNFPGVTPGLSVRPYLIANYLMIGGSGYYTTLGGGVSALLPISPQTQLSAVVETRSKNFYVNAANPNQRERDSSDTAFQLGVRHQLFEQGFIGVDGFYRFELARAQWHSNREFGATVSYTHLLDDYLGLTGLPWTAQIAGTRSYTGYNEADPSVVDTTGDGVTRRDAKWEVGGMRLVPVA